MENNLPEGWKEVQLIDTLETLESGSRPKGGVRGITSGIPSIGGEHLNDNGNFNFSNIKFIPLQFAKQMKRGEIKSNDILIVKDGATTGRVSFVNGNFPHKKAFVNEHVFICRPSKSVRPKYLFWFLWSQEGKNRILENFKGSAQGGINTGFASNILIPLAPISEQDSIINHIDEFIEKVQSNIQRLEKIPQILKRFRQSVLSAAVSGKLTNEWRDKNHYNEWKFKRAEDVCHFITKGTTPKGNELTSSGAIPFLKVYNIVNQQINFDYKPQFVSTNIHEGFLKRSKIVPGDVIMNIVGPPLGKIAIVTNQFPEWNLNQAIAIFRPKPELLSEFVYIILREGTPIAEIEKEFRGTAGQSNISLAQCRDFEFPIPSIEEQKEIVRRVEELFSLADKLEDRFNKAKAQVDKLPQSVLAKAFRGELVKTNSVTATDKN